MTDDTKQENPPTTTPDQSDAPAVVDDPVVSDGGLTLDDSEPEIAAPVENAAEKPADDIPETNLSLEMDETEAVPPAPAENPVIAEEAEIPATESPMITSPIPEEPSFAEQPAAETPAADDGAVSAAPPVTEPPQESFEENFDESPGDDTAAFGGGDDDGFGGDDFGDDDGFPSEDGMMSVPEKSGSKKKIMMAGGALVLAAVVGGGYFVLSSAGDVSPPPKRVAKVAVQDPGPVVEKNDFAATDTGSDVGFAGMTPPPQPAPLVNTDNLDTGFAETTELTAIAVEETDAVPPNDGWAMDDAGSADSISSGAIGDNQTPDDDNWTSPDYDPSRETVTLAALDDDALPPPPVESEAAAVSLEFAATAGETATEENADEQTAGNTTAQAAEAGTAGIGGNAADSAAAEAADDPLTETNGFTDSLPVAVSDLEPPGMTEAQTSIAEPPQTTAATVEKGTDPLTEPAVEAAIAPKPRDSLAPIPGEPPPILSGTAQVQEMMPPTKPALTPEEQMRIEQARMAMSQGELEGDAIEEHKKTLREIPAKEAMIRPLPKSYLIIQRTDGNAGKPIQPPRPQAGTSLATISTKHDLMGQAVAEQRAGNTAAALQTYEKILSDNPSDLNALTNMLGILRKQHTALALEKLTELHSLYPRHPGIAAQLAVTHADRNDYKEALRYFDIAASLDSPNAYYPFSKGVILDKMGRRGEANNYYQEALTMLERGHAGRQQVPLNALRRRLGIPAY